MSPSDPDPSRDIWSEWVLKGRTGGDPSYASEVQQKLERICKRVLDGGRLEPGVALLDIGCGDGLVGLGALARVGSQGRVVFQDRSGTLLRHAAREAKARGFVERTRFVEGSAEVLAGIADGEVDVVTTRAVLAYIESKAAAVREIHRVLRPGGRVSIGEPIFRDLALQIGQLTRRLEAQPASEATAALRLIMRWRCAQYPSTVPAIAASPLTNFSEWDMVGLFEDAGFSEIHLEFHIDVAKAPPMPWETFLDISPHPLAASLRSILRSCFSAEEAHDLEAHIRPSIEAGSWSEREMVAYLTAGKPA